MPTSQTPDRDDPGRKKGPPTGQSPDDPIEFEADTEVARGNEERANAEPEPAALHDAQVPGKPDTAQHRRDIEKRHHR